jgi:hypothetical protein
MPILTKTYRGRTPEIASSANHSNDKLDLPGHLDTSPNKLYGVK